MLVKSGIDTVSFHGIPSDFYIVNAYNYFLIFTEIYVATLSGNSLLNIHILQQRQCYNVRILIFYNYYYV